MHPRYARDMPEATVHVSTVHVVTVHVAASCPRVNHPSTCQVNLLKFLKATKGLPFYLAGSYAQPEKFNDVLDIGGVGVQVGSVGSI